MDPHGVKVLDRADDDAVVGPVAHHLHLVFLPTEEGFLDKDFRGRGSIEALGGDGLKLLAVVGDAASGAAEGEGRPDDEGEGADLGHGGAGLLHVVGGGGAGALEADLFHAVLEELAVLTLADGFDLGADQFDVVPGEGAGFVQGHGGVQGGLAPESGEESVRFFLGEDMFNDLRGDGLDIGAVGEFRIGHDGGRVAVDEDHPVALLAEGFASLDAGVVEFTGLTDDDGARTDDQDGLDVSPARHGFPTLKGGGGSWKGEID